MNSIPKDILQHNREKLKSILQENEVLILHTRDIMMKGDEEYFHLTDSWFRYFFGNFKNVDICDTFSFVTLNSQTAQKLVEVYRSKKAKNGKSLVEFSSN